MDSAGHATVKSTGNRLFAIDVLKAISIAAVVSYHAIFVPESTYAAASDRVEILFAPLRFCVPVLLTISWFLLARSLERPATTGIRPLLTKRLGRLLVPTLIWFTVAASLRVIGKVNSAPELLVLLRQGMVFPGAYYLLILLQLLIGFVLIHRWFRRLIPVLVTIGLQGLVFFMVQVALSGAAQSSLDALREIGRPFIGYWFAYLALGAFLQKHWPAIVKLSAQIPVLVKIGLVALTSLLMLTEYSHLYWVTQGQPRPFEYAMGSCLVSAVVYFLCVASVEATQVPTPVRVTVQYLSTYSLGIFCINGITSLLFVKLGSSVLAGATFTFPEILVIKLLGWIVLLAVSLSLALLLDRVGPTSCVR